jgi:hypothetical protein
LAYAINEKDEICHQPFFNIDNSGLVCLGYNDQKSIEKLTESFYTQPFIYCTDEYADSIRNYNNTAAPTRTEQFEKIYNNIKLIPIDEFNLMARVWTHNGRKNN